MKRTLPRFLSFRRPKRRLVNSLSAPLIWSTSESSMCVNGNINNNNNNNNHHHHDYDMVRSSLRSAAQADHPASRSGSSPNMVLFSRIFY
ncbi:unnamed protein product [Heligmosomoides polygyrus]|uniref:Secreted protein n=1 Tax=Heligmosomoides polygyrus TaxID=6339 RepID=A0A183FEX6_HELPZ|nr:unnamed protein product [Heligmosomoides polygyrus]